MSTYSESAQGLIPGAEDLGQQAIVFALLAINSTLQEVRNAIEADRTQCTDPYRSSHHCCGLDEDVDPGGDGEGA